MLLIALTISEAASILGISPSASKAEINSAYREAITKYHPDANRSKSPDEQKRAEQMFKQVGVARKTMLNPATAAPEPVDLNMSTTTHSTSSSSNASSNRQTTSSSSTTTQKARSSSASARTKQNYQASASASQYTPQGHNTAHSFNDNIPRVVDPAEEQIAEIYREETRQEYLSFSDKVRLTPSWPVSFCFLIFSLAIFFLVPFDFSHISLSNPCLLMAVVSIAKLVVYDTFVSYYLYKAISKITKNAWGVLCGAETILMGITALVLMNGSALVPPLALPILIGSIALGAIIIGASIAAAKAMSKKNK